MGDGDGDDVGAYKSLVSNMGDGGGGDGVDVVAMPEAGGIASAGDRRKPGTANGTHARSG